MMMEAAISQILIVAQVIPCNLIKSPKTVLFAMDPENAVLAMVPIGLIISLVWALWSVPIASPMAIVRIAVAQVK